MKKRLIHTTAAILALSLVFTTCGDKDKHIAVISVALNQQSATLTVGDTLTLLPTVLPADASNPALNWASTYTNVATVSNGLVVALSNGATTITVTTQDGNHTDFCQVHVGVLTDAELTAINCATTVNSGTFGTVTWGGNANIETQTWTITGTGANAHISQVWSDAVQVSNCDKTSYNGGSSSINYNTDCRNATNGFDGHYFSWCFVKRYEALLCPGDWRVPSREDFIDLDIALGGTGGTHSNMAVIAGYAGTSGSGLAAVNRAGAWGGARFTAFVNNLQDNSSAAQSNYWSSSESIATNAFGLTYTQNTVYLQSGNPHKGNGFALRCVR